MRTAPHWRSRAASALAALALSTLPALAQTAPSPPSHVGAFLDAAPTKIATGLRFAEGPLWLPPPAGQDGDGRLLVCDLGASVIYTLNPAEFRAAQDGKDAALAPLTVLIKDADKPAGATLHASGELLVAHFSGKVTARPLPLGTTPGSVPDEPIKPTVLTDNLDGVKLARCNDIIEVHQHILFTDFSGKEPGPNSPTGGLHSFVPSHPLVSDLEPVTPEESVGFGADRPPCKAHPTTRLDADFVRANGLCFDPARNALYVADMGANTIIAYNVTFTCNGNPPTLANRRVFADFADVKALGGAPDGMKLDANGNLFTTGPGGVWVLSPAGERLAHLPIPGASNLCFAPAPVETQTPPESRDLYITARDSVYRVRVKTSIAPK